jgi:hypothetical protein
MTRGLHYGYIYHGRYTGPHAQVPINVAFCSVDNYARIEAGCTQVDLASGGLLGRA